mmetsp:Transcript_58042/g.85072  ORF Transcript_58042/g.85072 Transcript_58042/m.85072 type:complete len:103 (-) Transcript_58042:29-337(-)
MTKQERGFSTRATVELRGSCDVAVASSGLLNLRRRKPQSQKKTETNKNKIDIRCRTSQSKKIWRFATRNLKSTGPEQKMDEMPQSTSSKQQHSSCGGGIWRK